MAKQAVSDRWESGDPYERYVGRWSRCVAPVFLAWLGLPAGQRWLDVGCGTGALSAAIADDCAPLSVAGIDPSEGFLKTARANLAGRAALVQASATAIPLADASVDVVVSGLVLNFIQNQRAALAEMARVSRSGGTVAAYVWDYAGKMEMMRHFWDAAVQLDAEAAELDQSIRFLTCGPQGLLAQCIDAGLHDPEVTAIDIATRFSSFDDYWQPFLGGQGSAPAYVKSLDAATQAGLRERLRERLPAQPDGAIHLSARAWAVRASVAK